MPATWTHGTTKTQVRVNWTRNVANLPKASTATGSTYPRSTTTPLPSTTKATPTQSMTWSTFPKTPKIQNNDTPTRIHAPSQNEKSARLSFAATSVAANNTATATIMRPPKASRLLVKKTSFATSRPNT